MSANDILGYLFTTLSFLSVVYAVFDNNTGMFACVLILFTLFSFCFLIRYLNSTQNKTYTLQILSYEHVETLIVSYTLKEVYRTTPNTSGAFILCPFVYAKKIKRFDIHIKYPTDPRYHPQAVCL